MTVYDELVARGILSQTSGAEEVKALINAGKAVFYNGFDPTADSLTVGHFVPLILMRHLQRAGNKPIVLLGGGTTMVGDPTDRSDMRSMLTREKIAENAGKFRLQMERFVDFSDNAPGKAIMLDNADWLLELNYIEFLRNVGVHFSVNRMLTAECYKARLEKGLSFLEFNYMLMQSYDYYVLHTQYGCNLQCGGDDQWANMLGGTELIRRKLGHDTHVLTTTLLLNSEGKKMGKTARGAVWLDPAKTSVYDFYQYFRNTADADVIPYLKRLTFLPLEEIETYARLEGNALNEAKERLATELTALVHGMDAALEARDAARALFGGGGDMENVPTTTLSFDGDTIALLDVLVTAGLAPSKSEARRLVEQGGVEVDGIKAADTKAVLTRAQCAEGCLLKKGKKTYHRIVV